MNGAPAHHVWADDGGAAGYECSYGRRAGRLAHALGSWSERKGRAVRLGVTGRSAGGRGCFEQVAVGGSARSRAPMVTAGGERTDGQRLKRMMMLFVCVVASPGSVSCVLLVLSC